MPELHDSPDGQTVILRARRVAAMLPDRAVIEDGAVLVEQGRVAAVGTWRELMGRGAKVRDLGEVTLTPGLVNAHTHLEFSHLGLPPVAVAGQGFTAWVGWLLAQALDAVTEVDVLRAAGQLSACGTAAVADIASRSYALVAGSLDHAGIGWLMQYEYFGYQPFAPEDGEPSVAGIPPDRLALAGHALYSTHPDSLRRAKAWDTAHGRCYSMHLAEHMGEVELLASGTGAFADLLRVRVLPPDFSPPGLSPVARADALGLLDRDTLAVHCVQVSPADIAVLRGSGATVCLCPRSNAVIGVGRAPAGAILAAGIPCCLGTDSLASVADLNLWEELRVLLALPGVSLNLEAALALVTRNAADVLGFNRLGRLAPGASARFSTLPPDLEAALDD